MSIKAKYTKLCRLAKLFADKVRKESVKSKISTYHFVFSSLYLYKNFVEKSLDKKLLDDDELNDNIVDFTSVINKYKVALDKAIGWMYTRMNDEKENSISLYLGYNKAVFELEKNFKENGQVITLNNLFEKVINDQNSFLSMVLSNRFGGFNVVKDAKQVSKNDAETYNKLLLSCYKQVCMADEQSDDVSQSETAQTAVAQDISTLFNSQTATKTKTSQSSDDTVGAISSTVRGSDKKSTAKVNENFLSKLVKQTKEMQKLLRRDIFGQDYAIKSFITGYFRSEIFAQIHKNRNKPRATFLFAGAPGVGKTFLAESVAKILGLPYKRFDMSEYADKEANIEFCGSDKVYKNGKAGNVTEFVEKNPKCVLLFDEVEKCHQVVTYLFLQMLDAGRLRDNYTDNEVSFTDAIIIFTTNAGRQLYENNDITTLSEVSRKVVLQALSEDINPVTQVPLFPKAICSRFASGNVVVFNNLNTMDLIKIVKGELNKNAIAYGRQFKTDIKIDDDVASLLLFAEGGKADARTIKSRAGAFFNDELYELLRLIVKDNDDDSLNNLKSLKIQLQIPDENADVKEVFVDSEKPVVLVLAPQKTYKDLSSIKDVDFIRVDTIEEAEKVLDSKRITLVLTDVTYGGKAKTSDILNLEDSLADGCKLINFVKEGYDVPVYIIENSSRQITDDEIFSFTKLGIYGVVAKSKGEHKIAYSNITDECKECYRQKSLQNLSKQNKIITYSTSQSISENGEQAQINLFNIEIKVAVDAKDSNSLLCSTEMPNVSFNDIIGANDAKEELKYFIQYLKKPSLFMSKGVKQPKGVLLYGPPGTGKTMLAKAMAKEAGVTFIAAEGNEFIKRYSGEGPEKVHELFRLARKYAPAILFIDEIDVIAKSRDNIDSSSVSTDVLTALLTELDGFKENKKPIFLLAATNYTINSSSKSLDPAIVRRFDRSINVDLPTREERKQYLNLRLTAKPIFNISEAQIENISQRSVGMSLAELEMVIEMALRNAIRGEKDVILDADFEEAFETYNSGEVKKWSMHSLERTARHEAGHALVSALMGEMPSYVTIVSRGDYGGYMQYANDEEKFGYTKAELLGKIATSLAGRAAELVYYGEEEGLTTGASSDIRSATIYAKQIICTYGMSKDFGLSSLYGDENTPIYPELRKEINKILAEQLQVAISLIKENKQKIDKLVKVLLEKNNLKENEIKEILS